jgi:hypothetical protein
MAALACLLLGLSMQALKPAAAFVYRLDVTEEKESESERSESDLFRRRCRCQVREPLPPDPSPSLDRSRPRVDSRFGPSVRVQPFLSATGVGAGVRLRC